MSGYLEKFKHSFFDMWERNDGISLREVRMSRFVYFAAYALELMLFNARSLFQPIGVDFCGIDGWTIAQVCHGIASLVFMFLWKENFKAIIKVAVAIMVVSFIPFAFLPYNYFRLIFGIIFYIGLGGAVTSARCGYAFALNNSERFIGMVVMFFTVTLFKFINSLGADGIIVTYVIPFSLLAALCVCLLKFEPRDFHVKEKSTKTDEKGIYWALAFFILYFAVDGYRAMLVDSGSSNYKIMCLGMLIAGILMFVLLSVAKLSTWHIWNMYFIFSIALALFIGFAGDIGSTKPMYFAGGLTFIGWPLCIYTLGSAQRRFSSYSLLKKCTAIFVIASPLSTVSSDLLEILFPNKFPIIAMLYIIVIVVGFLILSPYSHKYLFSAVWIKDLQKKDMRFSDDVNGKDKFESYNLTPRQKEIAKLLLSAKTRRQIAGELGISESTVKMHTSDLYKKLGINSKTELFKLFGVADEKN